MKIPEDMFWNAEIPLLDEIVENQTAYNGWINSEMQKARENYGR